MINKSSIDERHAGHVSKILSEDPEPDARAEAKEILDFYMKHYDIVQVVTCDGCHNDLCLEVLDPEKYAMNLAQYHHEGLRRIELAGSPLLASRKRLDGVMGYECACGNDTRNSSVELGLIPQVKNATGPAMVPSIEPHHVAMVRLKIAETGYKPDVTIKGRKRTVETFTTRRLKGPAYA